MLFMNVLCSTRSSVLKFITKRIYTAGIWYFDFSQETKSPHVWNLPAPYVSCRIHSNSRFTFSWCIELVVHKKLWMFLGSSEMSSGSVSTDSVESLVSSMVSSTALDSPPLSNLRKLLFLGFPSSCSMILNICLQIQVSIWSRSEKCMLIMSAHSFWNLVSVEDVIKPAMHLEMWGTTLRICSQMRIHPNIQTRGAVCYRTANRYPKPTNVSSAGSPV